MKYLVLVFLAVIVSKSCNSKKDFFEIKLEKENNLNLIFYSEKDTSFIIDMYAFSNECVYNNEDELIVKCIKDIQCIIESIRFNQAILVDQNYDMRFMTGSFYLKDEEKPIWHTNCMMPGEFELGIKGRSETITTISINYRSDLMVTENTSKIKIIYISKFYDFNEKDIKVIESNWIKI